jgi:hypothetical protein
MCVAVCESLRLGHLDIVFGQEMEIKDDLKTPLHLACLFADHDTVQRLRFGGDLFVQDEVSSLTYSTSRSKGWESSTAFSVSPQSDNHSPIFIVLESDQRKDRPSS